MPCSLTIESAAEAVPSRAVPGVPGVPPVERGVPGIPPDAARVWNAGDALPVGPPSS